MKSLEVRLDGVSTHEVELVRSNGSSTIWIDGRGYVLRSFDTGGGSEITINGRTERVWVVADRDAVFVHAFGRAFRLDIVDPSERALLKGKPEDSILAPMPGTVLEVFVHPGQHIIEGQALMIMESMKMQTEIVATRVGDVASVNVQVGDTFDRGAVLIALVSHEGEVP